MNTITLSTQLTNQVAANRDGYSYALNGGSFKIWSPCDEHKHEAFEGWDG